jgi:hypothetical protein
LVEQVECEPEHLASGLKLSVEPVDVTPDARSLVSYGNELLPDLLLGQVAIGCQIEQVVLLGVECCQASI